MEANEPPLYFRQKKLSQQYCVKLSCNYSNPAYATVFNSKCHSVFERKPTQLPPLAIRVSGDLQDCLVAHQYNCNLSRSSVDGSSSGAL